MGMLLAVGLTALWSVIPALAAGGWWVSAPASTPEISAVASNEGMTTLAISYGTPGWYAPRSGGFKAIRAPSGASIHSRAVAVAVAGGLGIVAYKKGQLVEVPVGGGWLPLPPVPGEPRAVALAGHDPTLVAVTTSLGLFSGPLGGRLQRVASGDGLALISPPTGGLRWLALVNGQLWESRAGRTWAVARGAPNFGRQTRALAQLSSGVTLVGQPGGLIWRGVGSGWSRAFQILPYGGLGGVPAVTALVADGPSSAYVATDGFGTLLTPDTGYSWYRAPPADATISALATVGPVFSNKPHGYVVALSPRGVFLHRLQLLPAPPTYAPTGEAAELLGTAAVTAASVLLVVLLLWLVSRRRRHLSV